jgi:general secretion pathway protein D
MLRSLSIFGAAVLGLALAVPAFGAADEPAAAPVVSCGNGIPGGTNCIVTKEEIKRAHAEFNRGVKLEEQNRLEEAYERFDAASRTVPQDMKFLTAREIVKAQLVFEHVERGDALLMTDAHSQATDEFLAALDLDPSNSYARSRLEQAQRQAVIPQTRPAIITDDFPYASEIHLEPKPDLATFHFRGDVRGLFNELATAYGVKVQFDESTPNKQVRFFVENVDFFTAIKLAGEVSKTMWAALEEHQMLIAADNAENHKQYDRMSLQTFVLPAHSTPQEATDYLTTLRTIFDLRFITAGQTSGTVQIRAPGRTLKACQQLLAQLDNPRPQVELDIRVFQISHQLTRDIGIHTPNTFTAYNIPAAALAGLAGLASGQNLSSLVNQLISGGGINQAGSSALSGLLSQLGGQQNNIFSTPLATFGGGMTFSGVSLDQITASLSLNESWVRDLDDVNMLASQGMDATFHLGERYPVLNASYAPVYNSPQISQVLGNQSYQAPVPSVSYEDLGIQLKAKPTVHADQSVGLQLELQVRSLTGQANNGVPIISNREYKGNINLKDGEPAFVAGEISLSDTLSMSGIPGFGAIPLFNQAMVTNSKTLDEDELMISITPHIVSDVSHTIAPEIWLSEK